MAESKKKPVSKSAYFFIGCVVGFIIGIVFSAWKLEKESIPGPTAGTKSVASKGSETQSRIAGLKKMLAVQPNNIDVLIQLGNDHFDLGKHEAAVEYYRKALEIDPKRPGVTTDLGISYRRLGKPEQAADSFKKTLEIEPGHPAALFNLGLVMRDDLKDKEQALKYWQQFLDSAGDAPHAVMVRPWVEQLRKEVEGQSEQGDSPKKK